MVKWVRNRVSIMEFENGFYQAKITPPQLWRVVPRPDLLARLEQGRQVLMSMIITPAGSGKTTLAADFTARQVQAPVAWLSLESSDQSFAQFGFYLVEAIKRVAPGFGNSQEGYSFHTALRQASVNLDKREVPQILLDRLAKAFISDVELLHHKKSPKSNTSQLWLVLDDYQFAQSPANNFFWQQVLRWVSPQAFHLLLLSRELLDGFAYAELIAQGRAQIIGVEQLNFKLGEVEALVEGQFGEKAPVVAQQLFEFSKGWAVALTLALLSLDQARWRPEYQNLKLVEVVTKWLAYIKTPANFHLSSHPTAPNYQLINEPLFNYLANAWFGQQTFDFQQFLLQTCLLETLSPAMCDRLTGRSGTAQTYLAALGQQQLFITKLDVPGQSIYQYHVLIKTFLQLELASHPELYHQNCKRAAQIYAESGQALLAVDYFLKAGETAEALHLANDLALNLYEAGRMSLLRDLLNRLPAELSQPGLIQARGWLAQEAGQLAEARQLFEEAVRLYEAKAEFDLAVKARAEVALAWVAVDEYLTAQTQARAVLKYQGESRWMVQGHSTAHMALGLVAMRTGQFSEAELHFQSAQTLYQKLNDNYRVNIVQLTQAQLYGAMGRIIKARSIFQRILPYWQRTGNLAREVYVHHMLASLLRRSGKCREAIGAFEENLERLAQLGYFYLEPYTYHEMGDCYRDLAEYTLAETYYARGYEKVRGRVPLLALEILVSWGLTNWLNGNSVRAYELFEEGLELIGQHDLNAKEPEILLALALAEMDKKRFELATQHLTAALELLAKYPSPPLQSRAYFLMAVVYFARNRFSNLQLKPLTGSDMPVKLALKTLVESLTIATPFFYDPYLPCELARAAALLEYLATSEEATDCLTQEEKFLLSDFLGRHVHSSLNTEFLVLNEEVVLTDKTLISPDEVAKNTVDLAVDSGESYKALLELKALDKGQVLKAGEEITNWPWAKSRWLLFYLVENPDVSLDKLLTDFWPESQKVKPNTAHSLISELRKTIKPAEIISQNRRYRLKAASLYYDAQEFERKIKRLIRQGEAAAPEELAATLALHRQEYLVTFSALWVEQRRRGLLDLYLEGAALLGQLYFEQGSYRPAIELWRQVLGYDPYYEEAHRFIIASYRALGQELEARRQQAEYDQIVEELTLN
jgi:LuxR family maltose regulon positive regulatory protein